MKQTLNNYLEKIILLLMVATVVTPLFYNLKIYEGFSIPKGIYFQIVVEIALIFWLILVFRDKKYLPKISLVFVSASFFLLTLCLSAIFGVDSIRSVWSSFDRMEGLNLHIHLFAYFVIASTVLTTEKRWLIVAFSSCLVAIFIAYVGITHKDLADFDRTFSTLGSAMFASIYFLLHIFILPFIILRFIASFKNLKYYLQIIIFFAFLFVEILYLILLIKSQTRASLLGLGVGIIVLGLLLIFYYRKNKIIQLSAATLLFLLIATSSFIYQNRKMPFVQGNFLLKRFTKFSKEDSAIETRLVNWKMAWQGFKEKPVLGWGQENYHYVFTKYYDPKLVIENAWFDRPHNLIFDLLISGGFLLFWAYLFILISAFYVLKKRPTPDKIFFVCVFAAYLGWAMFSLDSVSNLFILCLFLAYIQSKSEESTWILQKISSFNLPDFPKTVRGFACLICIASVIFIMKNVPIKAYETAKSLTKAMNSSDFNEMLVNFPKVYAEAMIGKQDIAEEFVARGTVVDASNLQISDKKAFYDAASKLILEENNRHEDYVRLMNLYGITLLGSNRVDDAIKIYQKTVELSPTYQVSLMQLALCFLRKNDYQNALKTFEKTYQIEPKYERPLLFKARTYALMGDTANVRKTIDRLSDREIYTNTPFVKEIYAIENKLDDFLALFYLEPKRKMAGYGTELFLVWATTAFDIGKLDYAKGALYAYDKYYAYRIPNQFHFIDSLSNEMVKNHRRPDDLAKIFPYEPEFKK